MEWKYERRQLEVVREMVRKGEFSCGAGDHRRGKVAWSRDAGGLTGLVLVGCGVGGQG